MKTNVTEEQIDKCTSNIQLGTLLNDYLFTEEQLEKVAKIMGKYCWWYTISKYQILSESFIEKHKDNVDWNVICIYQSLSEPFIEKFQDKVNWYTISEYQKLSEAFIEKHRDKVNWTIISCRQNLSESFIEKHKDRVNWYNVSKYQKLSESFIAKHYNKMAIRDLVRYQILSENFIESHNDILNLDKLYCYQDYSNKFAKKHNIRKSLVRNRAFFNHSMKTILSSRKYECHNDYFIAYKAIRKDRYSLFNFQYQYLPGETYESTCDCTNNENSFGLNVGTYEFAEEYLDRFQGLIVKCKVFYKDVGRVVHEGDKIRCFKIEILE